MTNSNDNRKKLNKESNKYSNEKQKGIFTLPLFIFLLVTSLIVILFNCYNHSYFKVSQVFIDGNNVISDEEILKLIKNPVGNNIFTYNAKKYKEILEDEENIKEARVEKEYPDNLKITIKEIYPFMKISNGGKKYIISNTGEILNSNNSSEGRELINLYKEIDELEVGQIYTNNLKELELVEKIQSYDYVSLISEFNFENIDDIGIIIGDIQIEFGDLTNTDYKLKLLDSVLKDIDQKEITAQKIYLNRGEDPVVEIDEESLDQESDE